MAARAQETDYVNRLPRLLVPELPDAGGLVVLDNARSHHLLRVLRVRAGQALEAMDGRGGLADAELMETNHRVQVRCSPRRSNLAPAPALVSWMPMIRPERLETAIEKLTELGVARIVLYSSACTGNLKRLPDWGRLERIVEAALEQSGNPWRPRLEGVTELATLLEEQEPALLTADPRATTAWTPPAGGLPGELALLAGPEGGFSGEEERAIERRRWVGARLGPHILRAETAMIALAGLVRASSASGPG